MIPLAAMICGEVYSVHGSTSESNINNNQNAIQTDESTTTSNINNNQNTKKKETVTIRGKTFNIREFGQMKFIPDREIYDQSTNEGALSNFLTLRAAFKYNIEQSKGNFDDYIMKNPELFRDILVLFDNLCAEFLPDMSTQNCVNSALLVLSSLRQFLLMKPIQAKLGFGQKGTENTLTIAKIFGVPT